MSDALPRLTAALADRYRVERELGAGGMATVYLAEDLRHRRKVAVKVLHPELSAAIGPERFLQEIELTASLQHPHILPLFDSGNADGQLYYVMPFVEGETLRARLDREQQLPVDDALRIAREVAGALDYAHGRGIIHRDIKPENILLQGGHALVADFGIALAVQTAGGQRMTQTGLSLGTPQYMAPEQAMGERAIDARADVYALAAVTYEMLVGEPPFTGANAQAIVAKVLTAAPPSAREGRATVSASVDAALARSLAKLPADRHASAGALVHAFTTGAGTEGAAHRATRAPRRLVPLTVAGVAGVAIGGALVGSWAARRTPAPPPAPIVRMDIPEPDGVTRSSLVPGDLLPDGSGLVYIGDGPAGHGLFVQSFLDGTARFLPFAEASVGSTPLPDGRGFLSYGFLASGLSRLHLVPANGGPVQALTDSVRYGLMVDREGRVYGSHHETGALVRVGADGRALTVIAAPDSAAGEVGYRFPASVGDGGILVTIQYRGDRPTQVGAVDPKTGRVRPLTAGVGARELAPGLLAIATDDGTLMAARLDARTLTLRGAPVPVLRDPAVGGAVFLSTSRDGSLVYSRSALGAWAVERVGGGRTQPLVTGTGRLPTSVLPHPLGGRIAIELGAELEVREPGSVTRRITTPGGARLLQWSMDGRRLVLLQRGSSQRTANAPPSPLTAGQLWTVSGELADAPTPFAPPGGGADSGTVGGSVGAAGWVEQTRSAGLRHHAAATGATTELGSGSSPSMSPDGRLVAFTTLGETGATRVVVAALPPRTGRWEVGPGARPQWSADGRWLYFSGPERRFSTVPTPVVRVPVTTSDGFAAGAPEAVATPPRNATLTWTVGPRDGMVYWLTADQRPVPVLVTNFARLADSLLTAAGNPR